MERIELKDFLQFKFLENLRLSQDGKYAAFVKRDCDEAGDCYPASLMVADTDCSRIRQLTEAKKSDILFTWDNEDILIAEQSEPASATTHCMKVDPATGAQRSAFEIPLRIKSIEPTGKGTYVLCAQTDLRKEEDKEENGADWYVFDELPFSANGFTFFPFLVL